MCAAAQTALVEDGAAALQYTSSNSRHQLRAQIAARMTRQGTPCNADDVLILHGGQQGLDLVAKLFLNPGDVVITENPTFLVPLLPLIRVSQIMWRLTWTMMAWI
jgi:2-aminoadipate transaminase